MAARIPPPRPGQPVPKEYVKEQLDILGIRNVTEEEIESYAADLTQLIKDTLIIKETNGAGHSLPTTLPPRSNTAAGPSIALHPSTSGPNIASSSVSNAADPHSSSALQLTPPGVKSRALHRASSPGSHSYCSIASTDLAGHGSAVFKTFPGDKENRVHFLSPSLSPSPMQGGRGTGGQGLNGSPLSSSLSNGGGASRQKVLIKRKVLRKCDGESRVFDESISEVDSDVDRPLARYLSDLSLTSVTSTEASLGTSRAAYGCKSFIRPSTGHPHTRRLKKHDPVSRYHEFQRLWADFKTPGERPRHALRWRIREQLLHQDVPYYEPQRRVLQPNDFVVPTDKKRSALRWEVRHALAKN